MKWSEIEVVARGPVVLIADRLNAVGRLCKAGTQIGPNIEGWPAHRVCVAVLHGTAEAMREQPASVALAAHPPAVEDEPTLTRKERKKKKHEGAHGL